MGAIALTGDEKPLAGNEIEQEPSLLEVGADGGKAYVTKVAVPDGGVELRVLSQAPYGRRKADAGVASCMLRLSDGGTRDQGALNRFHRSMLVGSGCEFVAQAISGDDDPDAPEEEKLVRLREKSSGGGTK